jgi:hypothetical protein
MIQNLELSYSDLEQMGFDASFIEDYQGLKRDFIPQSSSTTADPNNVFVSNLSGQFFYTGVTKALWFNPVPGQKTGWLQII